jgi:hypothetical protein
MYFFPQNFTTEFRIYKIYISTLFFIYERAPLQRHIFQFFLMRHLGSDPLPRYGIPNFLETNKDDPLQN